MPVLQSTNSCFSGVHEKRLAPEGPEFLSCLYERAHFGVVQIVADGRLKWANAAMYRMLGYTQDELTGKALEAIVPPEDYAQQASLLKKLLTGRYGHFDAEERFLHRLGFTVTAVVTSLAVNREGPESYCTNIVQDISDSRTVNLNFGLVIDSAPNPMAMIDREGNIIAVNTHCEALFGYEHGEMTYQNIGIFLPGAFRYENCEIRDGHIIERLIQFSDRGRELTGVHKEGALLSLEVKLHAIHFQNHEWMLASITDMTERNRALQNLQESEERFRTIFNDAPTGMALTSTAGRFIFVNRALCDFLGYGRNELSTKDLLTITHGEDKEATLTELQRMASGDDRNSTIETRYIHKSGQVLWGDVRRSLIRDSETKKPRYIVSQIVDITERKHMEQSLRETEARFRTIADSAPVLIWMADSDKKRAYFNRRWLEFRGRSLEKECGDGWIEGVHPQDVGNLREIYAKSFERRVPFSLSYRIKRFDGEYRWLVDTGTPRVDPDGSFAGYIGSGIDETDRRAAEDVLRNISRKLIEAQEKERKRIARELHDDINQRLAMLAIELQQLDSSPIFYAKRHERIERLLKRTMEISSDLQALSHELHSVTLEHLGVAAAMRGFCNDLARHQKVKIEFTERNLPGAVPPDIALALLRVLQEGVHNAVKHSGVRKLQAELIGKPGEIQLAIRDLGVGFNPEQAAKSEGLGLLSIRERILPFGGTLAITSKPKHGTELVVCVPVQQSLEKQA